MKKSKPPAPRRDLPASTEFLLYKTEDGRVRIQTRLEDETVWLTQQTMAQLFQTTQQNISQHIKNIIDEGELSLEATHKKFLSVQQEGSRQVQRDRDCQKLPDRTGARSAEPHRHAVSGFCGTSGSPAQRDDHARLD